MTGSTQHVAQDSRNLHLFDGYVKKILEKIAISVVCLIYRRSELLSQQAFF